VAGTAPAMAASCTWAHESPALFDVLLSRLETGQSPDIDFCERCWADLNAGPKNGVVFQGVPFCPCRWPSPRGSAVVP
jgi:hypothetical protein